MNSNITEKKDSFESEELIARVPAYSQEAEDAINDFLQKYPVNVPLHIVLSQNLSMHKILQSN